MKIRSFYVLSLLGCSDAEPVALVAPDDLRTRPAISPEACDDQGESGFFKFGVVVADKERQAVPDVAIGVSTDLDGPWTEIGRTGPSGRLGVQLEHAMWITPMALGSKPAWSCATRGEEQADYLFMIGETCPVDITVHDPLGLHPTEHYVLYAINENDDWRQMHVERSGIPLLAETTTLRLPCGEGTVRVIATDGRAADLPAKVDTRTDTSLSFTFPKYTETLSGIVQDVNGAPIAGARVQIMDGGLTDLVDVVTDKRDIVDVMLGPWVVSQEDGTYKAYVGGSQNTVDDVSYPNYRKVDMSFSMDIDVEDNPLWSPVRFKNSATITMSPVREVAVRCAGRPDEQCSTYDLSCTSLDGEISLSEAKTRNTLRDGQVVSTVEVLCPAQGDSVVRANGVSVRISPDEDVAWLDYRVYGGGIQGQLSGAPCSVTAKLSSWLPTDLVKTQTDADGRFLIGGLQPGTWTVKSKCAGATETEITVEDAVVDVVLQKSASR